MKALAILLLSANVFAQSNGTKCTEISNTDEYLLTVCEVKVAGRTSYTATEVVGEGMGDGSNTSSVRQISKAEYERWLKKLEAKRYKTKASCQRAGFKWASYDLCVVD
jgi:hypothetical protein